MRLAYFIGIPELWHTQYDFGPQGPYVHSVSGTIDQQGRSFNHGFEIQLRRATLAFEFAVIGGEADYLCSPTLFGENSSVVYPDLSSGDSMDVFAEEIETVVNCIQNQCTAVVEIGIKTGPTWGAESALKRDPP